MQLLGSNTAPPQEEQLWTEGVECYLIQVHDLQATVHERLGCWGPSYADCELFQTCVLAIDFLNQLVDDPFSFYFHDSMNTKVGVYLDASDMPYWIDAVVWHAVYWTLSRLTSHFKLEIEVNSRLGDEMTSRKFQMRGVEVSASDAWTSFQVAFENLMDDDGGDDDGGDDNDVPLLLATG